MESEILMKYIIWIVFFVIVLGGIYALLKGVGIL
tara:strand:+ start:231 stop:332 length:102 start_codon:yes stop_codon:yes gene_type:complete